MTSSNNINTQGKKSNKVLIALVIILAIALIGCIGYFTLCKQYKILSKGYENGKYYTSQEIQSTRTLLNLHNADPDQLEDYQNVIKSHRYDIMDVDLRKTSDGKWINIHNKDFKGVDIETHTYAEICAADPTNYPISFDEFLDFAVKYGVMLQIEDKTSPTGNLEELSNIVKSHDAIDLVYYSKNSYEVINESLNYFNSAMIFDVWNQNCTKEQAIELKEKAEAKGGKIILNSSINKNEYLQPDEVKEWANKGFLIEIGFNYTDGSKQAYLDFFDNYDIRFVNTIKVDNPTFSEYKAAFGEKFGFKAIK